MQTKNLLIILIFVLMLAVTVSSASAARFYVTGSDIKDSTGSTSKTTVAPGESVRLYSTVRNGGTGTTAEYATFNYAIYQGSTRVSSLLTKTASISPGSSSTQYVPISMGSSWSGSYEYRATVSPCTSPDTCQISKTFTVGGTTSAATFTVTSLDTANSAGSSRSSFTQGDTIQLKATVRNGGGSSGTASVNHQILRGSTEVCSGTTSGTVSAGSTATQTKSCSTSTSWTTGDYTYKATVSPCSSGTCYMTRAFTLSAGTPPSTPASLSLNSVSATDTSGGTRTSFAQGQSFNLVANVGNSGTTSGSATVSYSLTKSGTTYCTGTQSGTVSGGSSSNIQKSCSALSTWPVGDYTYTATVSPCSSTCSRSAIISITSSTPAAANFNVDAVRTTDSTGTTKTSFRQGETVYARATVRNAGTATGTVYINSYIRKDSVLITSSSTSYSLGAGSSYEALYPYTTTTTTGSGTYEYEAAVSLCSSGTCSRRTSFTITSSACADAYSCRDSTTIAHTLTNCSVTYTACPTGQTCSGLGVCSTPATAAFSLDSVWLTTTAGATATSFAQGASAMLKATVRNTATVSGTERTDFSITKDGTVLYQANQSHSVGAGAIYTEARTTTIPTTWENGTYYLTARVSPCSTGTCERTTAFSVTRVCAMWARTCYNSTHYGYQRADCSVAYPYACTGGRVCSAGSCVLPTCTPSMCGPHSHCGTTACVCDTNYSDDDSNLADGCEINLMNDTRNCGRVGAACIESEGCYAGECLAARSITLSEVNLLPVAPKGMIMTKSQFRVIASDAIANNYASAFYSSKAEEMAEEDFTAILDVVDYMEGAAAIVKFPLENPDLAVVLSRGDLKIVHIGEDTWLVSSRNPTEFIETVETIKMLDRISGALLLIEMGVTFAKGMEEYDGSVAHAIMTVGESLLSSGEILTVGVDIASRYSTIGTMADIYIFTGNRIPRIGISQLYRDFVSELNSSAHSGADTFDRCMSRGVVEGVTYCVGRAADITSVLAYPYPFIEEFNFEVDEDTAEGSGTYRLRNTNFLSAGTGVWKLDVVTNRRIYPQTQAFTIGTPTTLLIPSEVSGTLAQSVDSGERIINVTLTTYTACSGADISTCRWWVDTETVSFPQPTEPTAEIILDRTTFTEGETITFQTKADFNSDGATSIVGDSELLIISPVLDDIDSAEYDCAYAESCTSYAIPTEVGDEGTYEIEYRATNKWRLTATDTATITVVPAPPPPTYDITLQMPDDGASLAYTMQTFTWDTVPGVSYYYLGLYNAVTGARYSIMPVVAATYCSGGTCQRMYRPARGSYLWNVTDAGWWTTGARRWSETRRFSIV